MSRNITPSKHKKNYYFSIAMDEYVNCKAAMRRGESVPILPQYAVTPDSGHSMEHLVRIALQSYSNTNSQSIQSTIPKHPPTADQNTTSTGLLMLSEVSERHLQQVGKSCKKAKKAKKGLRPELPKKVIPLTPSPFNNGTFPFKLHEILKCKEYSSMITWQDHGRAWKVLNQEELAKVLPKFLPKQTKYSSFVRQVNLWGFTRITSGPDADCYYHGSFRRGKEMLCREMIRKKPVPNKKPPPDFSKC